MSETDRAAAYDAWYETPLGAAAHGIELGVVEELAVPRPGETALDAGCGTGIYAAWLAACGLGVTGVDRDETMLAAARRKAPGARFLVGDVTRLPCSDGEFDLALAVTVFCFLSEEQRRATARELVRVTRPGGRVVVGDLARLSLWAAQRRAKGWLGSRTWRAARFSTADEIERLLREAGPIPVATRHALYVPPVNALAGAAGAIERLGRPLGPVGAAFVAVRGDVPPVSS